MILEVREGEVTLNQVLLQAQVQVRVEVALNLIAVDLKQEKTMLMKPQLFSKNYVKNKENNFERNV